VTETTAHEIADGIFRLSTFVPGLGGPDGFTFNQFLIRAEEPLLFHCGMRAHFAGLAEAVGRIVDPARLRWLGYSHVEADECGALDQWLALAPDATAVHGTLGCAFWLNDTAARPPRRLRNDERLDLGGKVVRYLDTPHVPHDLSACVLFEETTRTLFCSDLYAHGGNGEPVTGGDLVARAIEGDKRFAFTPLTPNTAPTLRRLAALRPKTLAVMHGSSHAGDATGQLEALAAHYEDKLRRAVE
jgi:flavorubredoxin